MTEPQNNSLREPCRSGPVDQSLKQQGAAHVQPRPLYRQQELFVLVVPAMDRHGGGGHSLREVLVPFDFEAGNPHFKEFSPTGRVPVLHHGDVRVWQSLAIIEYVAELYPEAGIWPAGPGDRGRWRALFPWRCFPGFRALRNACPMNIRRPERARSRLLTASWPTSPASRRSGVTCADHSGGPFLFGDFSAADAMFAPVVNRFDVYDLVSCQRYAELYRRASRRIRPGRSGKRRRRAEAWIVRGRRESDRQIAQNLKK